MRLKAVFFLATAIMLPGCSDDGPRVPDTSSVEISLHIERLDQDLFHARPDSMAAASLKAYATYGEFYRTYIEDILQGAPVGDPRLPVVLTRFVSDPDWSAAQEAIDSVFGDMESERREFEEAFKRLRVLFPDSLVPRVVVFNSGFNYGVVPTDSVLGIGAEWFIGSDHPVIAHLAPETFPRYVKDRMLPDMLVPSAVKGWLMVHYMRWTEGADVLTDLVEVGKVMALLDVLVPGAEPHSKFAFSKEQLAWCRENELGIWKDIVTGDKLFSRKAQDVGRLMNDGPFTSGLPRESPGHIGEWIGYRMVRSYMKANPRVSFAQLFAMEDPREILRYYKPR